MNDTAPQTQDLHQDLPMARSNEERFKMGVSMCQTARTIVWSLLPEDLAPTERRVQFFLRYYGNDLDPVGTSLWPNWGRATWNRREKGSPCHWRHSDRMVSGLRWEPLLAPSDTNTTARMKLSSHRAIGFE